MPFGPDNPVLLINDSAYDSWFGEMALLAASTGRIDVVGVVVNTTAYHEAIDENVEGWQGLLDAATASGMKNVPTFVRSVDEALVRPEDGNIDSTSPNDSDAARYIIDMAMQHGSADLPLVVITASKLTEIADAYLLEPSIADRTYVVATLGSETAEGCIMGAPNGEQDVWAGNIVAQRLRFMQVSNYYDQDEDVPDSQLAELPANPFGDWVKSKHEVVVGDFGADQATLAVFALPDFGNVQRVAYDGIGEDGTVVLKHDAAGCCWFVSGGNPEAPKTFLWELLRDPAAFPSP